MSLPKLDAIIQAGEEATPRPWQFANAGSGQYAVLGTRGQTITGRQGFDSFAPGYRNAAYIVEAANAAEDMARLLGQAYWMLVDTEDYLHHQHGELCDVRPECCVVRVAEAIEARFGQEGESA